MGGRREERTKRETAIDVILSCEVLPHARQKQDSPEREKFEYTVGIVLSLTMEGNDMRLTKDVRALSTLALILLLIVSFVLGATLSYIFTLGFYAGNEYRLPDRNIVALQSVNFSSQNATFFNVTVINPSYSPSAATVQRIEVVTKDGNHHSTVTPSTPFSLDVGSSRTLPVFWNWGNYTGQSVLVSAIAENGLGSNLYATTPFMNLSITSINFYPSVTAHNFTISVQNSGSPIPVDITGILVNDLMSATSPSLSTPLGLSNATGAAPANITVKQGWADFQNKSITVAVQTLQGYTAYKVVTGPAVTVSMARFDAIFDVANTSRFNLTLLLNPFSGATLDVSNVTVSIGGNVTVVAWNAVPSTKLEPLVQMTILCTWDWSGHRGQNVIVTVDTVQGFEMIRQFSIPA